MSRYITIEKVREEIQDRTPADNSIDCDQVFSDEEILYAMERAASIYNSMSPIGIGVVSAKALPLNLSFFMDAVVSQLLKSAIHKLSRNLMKWQTGDTQVDLEQTRMQAFTQIRGDLEKQWRQDAKEYKMELNRAQCWDAF